MRVNEAVIGELRKAIESVPTGANSPEEILEHLDKIGMENFVTAKGDLAVKVWQFHEGFVDEEYAAIIRANRFSSSEGDKMDWLSNNLQLIQEKYAGQWIGVGDNEIIASAPTLLDLLALIGDTSKPLVTFIPVEPIVWTFTYGIKGF